MVNGKQTQLPDTIQSVQQIIFFNTENELTKDKEVYTTQSDDNSQNNDVLIFHSHL